MKKFLVLILMTFYISSSVSTGADSQSQHAAPHDVGIPLLDEENPPAN
ncbi:MAG: hypothetical protein WBF39_06045 [Planococcus donghaensis]